MNTSCPETGHKGNDPLAGVVTIRVSVLSQSVMVEALENPGNM